jgi:hypothetical protein
MRPRAKDVLAATCLAAVILIASAAAADPLGPADVPEPLRPWIPWALDGAGDASCPAVDDAFVCAWLAGLELVPDDGGATFRLDVLLEKRGRVALPGSTREWPVEVTVGGEALVVLEEETHPFVTLDAGRHVVEGRFAWRAMPELLAVPPSVARVALEVDGKRIEQPRRNDDGAVWLEGGAAEGNGEPERLELVVVRRVEEGVPLLVTTRLELRVGGRRRELTLPSPLLPGGELLGFEGAGLPVRWGAGGELMLEISAGTHTVTVIERHAAPPEALALGKRPAPWPESEIWAWQPRVELRQVEVSGGSPIDPAHTNLPREWQTLAAFQLRAPASFAMKTLRRGHADPPPNQLSLRRELWLDLDGDGFSALDSFSGQRQRDWRLAFASAGELGHVRALGADQLITLGDDGSAGVELHAASAEMQAEWRAEHGLPTTLPAVGWTTDVQHLEIQLNLPPGWELLGASGADVIYPSWTSRWDLFDVLVILLVALGVGRVAGWRWTPIAALALTLTHGVGESATWAWLLVAAIAVLLREVRTPRWRAWLRAGWFASGATLVFLLAATGVGTLGKALAPEELHEDALVDDGFIEAASADNREGGTGARAKGEGGAKMQVLLAAAAEAEMWGDVEQSPERAHRYGVAGPAQIEVQRQVQDPAIIQTGHGVPTWRFSRYVLRWIGPVESGHELRLWLLSPTERSLLALLGAALGALVVFMLLRATAREDEPPIPASGAALALLLVIFSPGVARADTPSAEMLEELKTRLSRAPDCAPSCASVSRLSLRVAGDELEIRAEVHAAAVASVQLPGPAESWVPTTVRVDGESDAALVLHGGHLHLRVSPGIHEVTLRGPLRGSDLTLALGTSPHRVEVEADGWKAEGVDEDGHADSVHLERDSGAAEAPREERPDAAVPPWLEVRRTLEAGVSWTMRTVVKRVSAPGTPVVVRLPLLPGEKVTDASFEEHDGELVITLDRDARELQFTSALDPRERLELRAPTDRPWSEQWTLRCSPIWHCEHSGLAPVSHEARGMWEPVFQPWPGEAVTLDFVRPTAAPGRSLTIQSADLLLEPRDRLTEATLTMRLQTSAGGAHPITLPAGVRVTELRVDGKAQPVQLDAETLPVSLTPGWREVVVKWREAGGLVTFTRAPAIRVGDAAANVRVTITLPRDRWPLLAGGPSWGSRILLWGYLLLLVAAGAALGSLPRRYQPAIGGRPLARWHWMLLAAGLTQVPPLAAAVIAAWFFLIAFRARWPAAHTRGRNAGQIALAIATLAFVGGLALAAYRGVAVQPDMMVAGDATAPEVFTWYVDHGDGWLPRPWVLSTTPWLWRGAMAAWSAWMLVMLWRWLRSGWAAWTDGGIWVRPPKPAPAAAPAPEAPRAEA